VGNGIVQPADLECAAKVVDQSDPEILVAQVELIILAAVRGAEERRVAVGLGEVIPAKIYLAPAQTSAKGRITG